MNSLVVRVHESVKELFVDEPSLLEADSVNLQNDVLLARLKAKDLVLKDQHVCEASLAVHCLVH